MNLSQSYLLTLGLVMFDQPYHYAALLSVADLLLITQIESLEGVYLDWILYFKKRLCSQMHFLVYAVFDSTHNRFPVNGRRKAMQLIATLIAINLTAVSIVIIGPPPFDFDIEWLGIYGLGLFIVVHLFIYLYFFRSGRIDRICDRMGPKYEGRKWILKLSYYLWLFVSTLSIPLAFFLGAYYHQGLIPSFLA